MGLKYLWVQKVVRAGRVMLIKEASETNFADLMTKHLAEDRMVALLQAAGYTFREGRAPGAPELVDGATKVRLACVRRSGPPPLQATLATEQLARVRLLNAIRLGAVELGLGY